MTLYIFAPTNVIYIFTKLTNKSLYYISITEETVDTTLAENGKPFTLYHDAKDNVTFCTIRPPYKATMLRRNFQDNTMPSEIDNTQITR